MNSTVAVEDGDDDLLEMERQFERREAGELEFPSRPPTPAHDWDFEEPPANAPGANNGGNASDEEEDLRPSDTTGIQDTTTPDRFLPSATILHRPVSGPQSNISTSSSSTIVENASPGPGPSTLKKRKRFAQDLFDDDSPLTEEECEPPAGLPIKKKRGRAASKKVPAKAKAGRTKA